MDNLRARTFRGLVSGVEVPNGICSLHIGNGDIATLQGLVIFHSAKKSLRMGQQKADASQLEIARLRHAPYF